MDQELYMKMQQLGMQMQNIHQQLQAVDQQIQDILATEDALIDLEKTPIGTEILVPIATGIFARAKLEDNKDVLINVGASVNSEKPIKDTVSMVKNQLSELESIRLELASNLEEVNNELSRLQQNV